MTDPRNEDQKVAAVNASMIMAGQPMSAQDEAIGRKILRGVLTGDEAVLKYLEENGFGDSARAAELRRRIAGAA
ncbi:antitoxin VbhA family protein [Corynebacterium coyleae]